MKRVLMLAYYFPPSKAAGTFRTLRFVRDLPAHGWAPSVLTVRSRSYPESDLDPGLLLRVPAETGVHRTLALPYHRWYKRAVESGKMLRRGRGHSGTEGAAPAAAAGARPAPRSDAAAAAGADGPAAGNPRETAAAIGSALDLAYMLCRTPDIDAGWYWPALARGLWVVARERPQVLYASGGPWTTFLVARDLARLTRLPLVLDYRDPWTLNPAVARRGSFFETLALGFERTVVGRARAIVANTDVLRETLMRAHGERLGERTRVIHNSYDAADYAGPEPAREPVFTLSYVGALYDAHSPEPFLLAVARLVSERPDLRGRFRVRLVGAGAPRVAARVQELGLGDTIRVQEPVSHAEAIRLQRAAHALLLFLTVPSDHSTFVPSKLFEYVAANRPILAVTRGGALERLLRGEQLTPWVFDPEDVMGIAQGVLNLIERHERGSLPVLSEATVRSFSGAAAARALAAVLEAARTGAPLPALAPGAEPPVAALQEVGCR